MDCLRRSLYPLAATLLCSCSGGDAPAPQKSAFAGQEQALERARDADRMVQDAARQEQRQIEEQSE